MRAERLAPNPIDGSCWRSWRPRPEARPGGGQPDARPPASRLDLTGLPPTPEDVEAFVDDKSADAYAKLVDRLLASPQWGEHRGRYWLDAARYADTHGIHFDNYREIWPYRDWVIGAFNGNMPFDRFTIEQLAGDLLPEPDARPAGRHRASTAATSRPTRAAAIDEEYASSTPATAPRPTSQVWMGLTSGCAVCHDHKFDPITQKEFYRMAAFFNNTTQAAMDGNIKDTPPVIVVPQHEDRGAVAEARPTIADRRKTDGGRPQGRRRGRVRQVAEDREADRRAGCSRPRLAL